jgi:PAS domain-containing protein
MQRPDFDSLTVLEHLPVALLITRPEDGSIVYLNARASDLLQLPRETALTLKGFDFLVDPDDRDEMVSLLESNDVVRDLTVRIRSMAGREYRANLSAALLTLGQTRCSVILVSEVREGGS